MGDSKPFNPLNHSIVSVIKGDTFGQFECPDYVEAFLMYLLREIDRVFYNLNGREWDRDESPLIAGVHFRPYYWSDSDEEGYDEQRAAEPNFAFEDVEIRWYKHAGCGMSLNVSREPAEWAGWFERCLKAIHNAEPHVITEWREHQAKQAELRERHSRFFAGQIGEEKEIEEVDDYRAALESLAKQNESARDVLSKWKRAHDMWRHLSYAFEQAFKPEKL